MTASETLKLYQLFFQLTKNETEAKSFVSEFERSINNTIDTKFEKEEKRFVPKNEFDKIDYKIDLLRQEMKALNSDLRADFEKRLNQQIIWTISTGIAVVGIIIAFLNIKK